jgi:glucose-1-phosphate adenylyltransferase
VDGMLAIILAGGRGTRLGPLTKETPKPVLPFAGMYRLVDFVFSNCLNSGVQTILFVTRERGDAVSRYIERLRDAVRPSSRCRILTAPARESTSADSGTAEAVHNVLPLVRRIDPRTVLVLASDHVYGMDYSPLAVFHQQREAGVTIGSVEVPSEEAYRFGVLATDEIGRITSFAEKPPRAFARRGTQGLVRVSMGIYAFSPRTLEAVLCRDALDPASSHDFGRDVIPSLVRSELAWAYPFAGYWRDVGTLASYVAAHCELLRQPGCRLLHDPVWPLTSAAWPRLDRGLRLNRHGSLVCPGSLCEQGSRVRGSTIAPATWIGQGAVLDECVVLDGASVGRGARLRRTVVDVGASVPEDALLGCDLRDAREPVVFSGASP